MSSPIPGPDRSAATGPTPWDPLDDQKAQVRTQLVNVAHWGRMTCPPSCRAARALLALGAVEDGRITEAGQDLLVALQTGRPVHLPHIPSPWGSVGEDQDVRDPDAPQAKARRRRARAAGAPNDSPSGPAPGRSPAPVPGGGVAAKEQAPMPTRLPVAAAQPSLFD